MINLIEEPIPSIGFVDSADELISGFALTRTRIESQQRFEGCSLTYTESHLSEEQLAELPKAGDTHPNNHSNRSIGWAKIPSPQDIAPSSLELQSNRRLGAQTHFCIGNKQPSLECFQSSPEDISKPTLPISKKKMVFCYGNTVPEYFSAVPLKYSPRNGPKHLSDSSPTRRQSSLRSNTLEKPSHRAEPGFSTDSLEKAPTKKYISKPSEKSRVERMRITVDGALSTQATTKDFARLLHRATPKLPPRKTSVSTHKTSNRFEGPASGVEQLLELHVNSRRIDVKPKPSHDRSRKGNTSRSKFLG